MKLQICFKWPCRVHDISVFTAFPFLILESRSFCEDVDEMSQEQLFLQHTRELPMEALRSLRVWNDGGVVQKDLCNGLAWAPTDKKHGNMELCTSSWTLFLPKASLAGRFSVVELCLVHDMMSHTSVVLWPTFFSMLLKVVIFSSLKMMLPPEVRACRTSKSICCFGAPVLISVALSVSSIPGTTGWNTAV